MRLKASPGDGPAIAMHVPDKCGSARDSMQRLLRDATRDDHCGAWASK